MGTPLTLSYPSELPESLKSVPIVDVRGTVPINPKYTWISLKGPRNISDLDTIVFHHTGIPKSQSAGIDDRTWINQIAKSHIRSTKNIPGGDPSNPYHAMIRSGILFIVNDLEAFTYGVAGHNANTVHISVDGDYANFDTLTDRDRAALYAAFFFYKGVMPNYKQLLGHKELTATACPGYNMDKVRKDLAAFELDMTLNSSPNTVLSRIFGFHTRYLDLYNKAIKETDPNRDAARYKLNQLIDEAVAAGIYTPQQ